MTVNGTKYWNCNTIMNLKKYNVTRSKRQNIYIYSEEDISDTNLVPNILDYPTMINSDTSCVIEKLLKANIDNTNQ